MNIHNKNLRKQHLDSKTRLFVQQLKECEEKEMHGGIILTPNNFRIEEVWLAHIMEQKKINENKGIPRENTLMVGPPSWMSREESINEDFPDLSTGFFYHGKSTENGKDLADKDVVFAIFEELTKLDVLMKYKWKRVIFHDTYAVNISKDALNALCQLNSENHWCLTTNPYKNFVERFLKLETNWVNMRNALKKATLRLPSDLEDYYEFVLDAKKAKEEYDTRRFSNDVWSAIESYTRSFYKMNLEAEVNEENLEDMYTAICVGLNSSEAALIMRVWVDAHWNHSIWTHDDHFIPPEEMKEIIVQLESAVDLIKNANTALILKKLHKMKLLDDSLYNIDEMGDASLLTDNSPEQEIYDFDVFMAKAEEMSNRSPPDLVLFSTLIWGAAVVCIRKFFLVNFRIDIPDRAARKEVAKFVLCSLSDNTTAFLHFQRAWEMAKKCDENFYTLEFLSRPYRNEVLQSVGSMEMYIKQSDWQKIKEKLHFREFFMKRIVGRRIVKIGKTEFEYNYIIL